MQCPNCGQGNRDEARFCDHCGARLSPGGVAAGAAAAQGGVAAAGGVAVGRDVHGDVLVKSTKIVYTGHDPEAAQRLLNRYLRWLIGECAPLRLKAIDQGAARPNAQPLGLTSVYVDLNLDFHIPKATLTLKAWLARRPFVDSAVDTERVGDGPRVAALEALAEHPRLVLLGAPGSGKSTLSLYLALSLAEACLGATGALERIGPAWTHGPLLPVRVVLRQFAASLPADCRTGTAQHLWDYLAGEWRSLAPHGELESVVRDLTDKAGVLFLLDGLDEVGDGGRRTRVLEAVQAFVASAGPASRFLLTARPYAWEAPEQKIADFPAAYRLADFDSKQIAAFIERWYTAVAALGWVNAAEATEQTASLRIAVKRPDLQPLAQNPLLLTLMATLHSNRGRLPDDRADLYNEVVELLLQRWNEPSGADRGLLDTLQVPSLKLADLRGVIERVAYDAHAGHIDRPGPADIPGPALLEAFRPLLGGSLDKAEQVLAYIEDRAGLLLGQGGHGALRQYSFPHRTFQEFLAACYLAGQDDLGKWAFDLAGAAPAHWAEVLKLAARRAGLSRGTSAADALVRRMSVDAFRQSGHAFATLDWHRAALAGSQLLEIGTAALNSRDEYLAVRGRMAGWLAALIEANGLPAHERVEAAETLAQLGDPRFDPHAWHLPADGRLGFVEVPAGPFLMGTPAEAIPALSADYSVEEKQLKDESPQHEITLPRFLVARYPVTVAQFLAFVETSGFQPGNRDCLHGISTAPVVNVNWGEARAYCAWLTETLRAWDHTPPILATLLRDEGWEVALPTEAQWEKAARGSDGRGFPWGAEFDPDRANMDETRLRRRSPAGCFPLGASPCNCLDMAGNVWEWCLSTYRPYPYWANDGREEITNSRNVRVLRGGGFGINRRGVRCAYRSYIRLDYRYGDIGFRVVVTPIGGT